MKNNLCRTWFTSDTHFYHERMMNFCARPFGDAEEMNECLIENWNNHVRPSDTIYHLGDLMWSESHFKKIIPRLNGKIHLILGNHDHKPHLYQHLLSSVEKYKEIKINKQKICLFHYPMVSWNAHYHGSWNLFGHVHDTMSWLSGKMMDVGVDSVSSYLDPTQNIKENYRPISFDEVKEIMDSRDKAENPAFVLPGMYENYNGDIPNE